MYDNYNYPAGADTPDAPWNQTDVEDIYESEASERIDEEIDDHSDTFIDWACDEGHLDEDFTDADVEAITGIKEIRDAYYHYRLHDVCCELAEEEADERAYHESEAYEAYREAYLLGD